MAGTQAVRVGRTIFAKRRLGLQPPEGHALAGVCLATYGAKPTPRIVCNAASPGPGATRADQDGLF